MKTLFYITPRFPPVREVGARRAMNIARHLKSYGWETIVFTAPLDSSGTDPELQSLIPEDLPVYRDFGRPSSDPAACPGGNKGTGSFLPARMISHINEKGPYYIPFDQYRRHVRHAFKSAKDLVIRHRPDLILVNADPWSALLLGHRLSRWSGIPWIADLRDPWSLHEYKMRLRPALIRSVIRHYERMFFNSASRVVFNTGLCCEAYRNYYADRSYRDRMVWIRNAFDPTVYYKEGITKQSGKFSLHYFGTFRIYMDPAPMFRLLQRFIESHGLAPKDVELVLYGRQRPQDIRQAESLGLREFIRIQPDISVREAMQYLRSASVLMLVEGSDRRLQLPAKLYDYLAARRPIFALSENPELDAILQQTGAGLVADCNNMEAGMDRLDRLYRGVWQPLFNDAEMEKYSVRYQVQQFADLFNVVQCHPC